MYCNNNCGKSNIANALGIFHGKKRFYNELILRSLVTSPKTVKQIAQFICQHDRGKHPKHVYSVIDRPKGRLWELSSKGYIEKREGKWQFTFKGFCVALTLLKTLDEVTPFMEVFDQMFKAQLLRMFDKHPLCAFFKFKSEYMDERVREILKRVEDDSRFSELLLLKLKEYTEGLIREGVDLDVLSVEEFTGFIGGKLIPWFLERYVS